MTDEETPTQRVRPGSLPSMMKRLSGSYFTAQRRRLQKSQLLSSLARKAEPEHTESPVKLFLCRASTKCSAASTSNGNPTGVDVCGCFCFPAYSPPFLRIFSHLLLPEAADHLLSLWELKVIPNVWTSQEHLFWNLWNHSRHVCMSEISRALTSQRKMLGN